MLLAAIPNTTPESDEMLTLCPGQHTTATMLFKMFYGSSARVENTLFSEIMPRLQDNSADFGVCIHEGRFTWEQHGLHKVEDLGTRWEQETSSPLPLGGILARRSLDKSSLCSIQQAIRNSIEYGLSHREETVETMKQHAQEFDESVLFQHVDLYVNDWTIDLGATGAKALELLSQKARESGLVNSGKRSVEVATF